jgi:hypothetical protein
MPKTISICDWLEERSQEIMNRINHLIDVSDKYHLEGNVQHSELVDSQIDILYNKMNRLDDRLIRILSRGYKNGQENL